MVPEQLEPRVLLTAYVTQDPLAALGVNALVAEHATPAAPEGQVYFGYGASATGLGDVDADGYGDYAVAAPGRWSDFGAFIPGAVFVRSGRTGDVLHTLGDGAGLFGVALADMGDVDSDGVRDLAVGSPRYNDTGRVWVFSGRTGETLLTLDGEGAGDEFGAALASMHDRGSDGVRELLIGAPGSDAGRGRASIHSGSGGDELARFDGENAGDRFGTSVAASVLGDFAIGAPRFDASVGEDAGRVYAYRATNALQHASDGRGAGDELGVSLAMITRSPQWSEAYSLLLAGAPGADVVPGVDTHVASDRGAVYAKAVVPLGFEQWLAGPNVSNARFGVGLANVGDLDGDTGDDVGVAAAGLDDAFFFGAGEDGGLISFGWSSTGFGNFNTGINVLPGAPGAALSGVGDINNDGFPDILLADTVGTARIYGGYAVGGPLHLDGASPDLRYAWSDFGERRFLIAQGVIRTYDKVAGLADAPPGAEDQPDSRISAISNDGTIAFQTRPTRAEPYGAPMFLRHGVVRTLESLIITYEGTVPDLDDLRVGRLHDGYRAMLIGAGTYALIDGVLTEAQVAGVDMNSSGAVLGYAGQDGFNRPALWSRETGRTFLTGLERAGRVREDGAVVGVLTGTTSFLNPGRLAVWQNGIVTDLGAGIGDVFTSTVAAHWVFRSFDDTGRILAEVVTNSYRGPANYRGYVFEPDTGLRRLLDISHRRPVGAWSTMTDFMETSLIADDGRILYASSVLEPVDEDAPFVLREGSPSLAHSAGGQDFVVGISQYDELVLFRRSGAAWERFRLSTTLVSPGVDDLVIFTTPHDLQTHVVLADRGRLDLFHVTGELGAPQQVVDTGSTSQAAITDKLTVLINATGSVNLIGTAGNSDVVVYYLTPGVSALFYGAWRFDNISQNHLAVRGLDTPRFVSNLTTFSTSWNTMHVAGLDSNGNVQVIWWAPDSPLWRADDLSANAVGASAMTGRVSAFVTPWNTLHVNGVDAQGETVALWWAPGFGGQWRIDRLVQSPGVRLRADSITSYLTPWGGLNVVGRDVVTGRAVAYWWSAEAGRWTDEVIRVGGGTPGPALTGELSATSSASGELSIVGRATNGHVARLWWEPGDGYWSHGDLTTGA